jgi:hypothetical protein
MFPPKPYSLASLILKGSYLNAAEDANRNPSLFPIPLDFLTPIQYFKRPLRANITINELFLCFVKHAIFFSRPYHLYAQVQVDV